MVQNLPCNAGDVGSIPGRGTKIPHVMEQLCSSTASAKPMHFGAHTSQLKSPCSTTKDFTQ